MPDAFPEGLRIAPCGSVNSESPIGIAPQAIPAPVLGAFNQAIPVAIVDKSMIQR